MKIYKPEDLTEYLKQDSILELIKLNTVHDDEVLTCQRWLMNSPAKRMIFADLYDDLLQPVPARRRRVLDIGGGITALTRLLTQYNDYSLVDVMAHDEDANILDFFNSITTSIWCGKDWWTFKPQGRYDIVVANDLFPNVDQRLDQFIRRMIPHCAEIRLSITFYPTTRFYNVKRLDADEVMCLLAYNYEQVTQILDNYKNRFLDCSVSNYSPDNMSLFENGRIVGALRLKGDLF